MTQASLATRIAAVGGFALGLAWGLATEEIAGKASAVVLGVLVMALTFWAKPWRKAPA